MKLGPKKDFGIINIPVKELGLKTLGDSLEHIRLWSLKLFSFYTNNYMCITLGNITNTVSKRDRWNYLCYPARTSLFMILQREMCVLYFWWPVEINI